MFCVKGGFTCALLDDPAGLFYGQELHLIVHCSCSGSRRDRMWGVREPEAERLSSSSVQGDSKLTESSLGSFQVAIAVNSRTRRLIWRFPSTLYFASKLYLAASVYYHLGFS